MSILFSLLIQQLVIDITINVGISLMLKIHFESLHLYSGLRVKLSWQRMRINTEIVRDLNNESSLANSQEHATSEQQ